MEKSAKLLDFLLKNKEKLISFLSIFEEKTFRQSREIIDNKLNGERSDKNQLSLFDIIEGNNKLIKQENTTEPIIKGLDFSPAEDKLIHTISLILSRKSERYDQSSPNYYMGNYEKGTITIDLIDLETARMVITPHETLFNIFRKKRLQHRPYKIHIRHFWKLAKRNFLITLNFPSKTVKKDEKKKFNKIRTYLPVFQVVILNPDLTESESQENR